MRPPSAGHPLQATPGRRPKCRRPTRPWHRRPSLLHCHPTRTRKTMSRSLNKVMLIGNVGADPEMRSTPGGMRMAKVSLATSRTFKDRNGQEQEKTEWHRLTFWDKLAEIVERYVKKGDRIYVEGRVEYSTTGEGEATKYWTD